MPPPPTSSTDLRWKRHMARLAMSKPPPTSRLCLHRGRHRPLDPWTQSHNPCWSHQPRRPRRRAGHARLNQAADQGLTRVRPDDVPQTPKPISSRSKADRLARVQPSTAQAFSTQSPNSLPAASSSSPVSRLMTTWPIQPDPVIDRPVIETMRLPSPSR
jgi:hypothetical protein